MCMKVRTESADIVAARNKLPASASKVRCRQTAVCEIHLSACMACDFCAPPSRHDVVDAGAIR